MMVMSRLITPAHGVYVPSLKRCAGLLQARL